MKRRIVAIGTGMIILLTGCLFVGEAWQTVELDEQVSIHLPAAMKQTRRLNSDTNWQFEDVHRELYVIVRIDSWDRLLLQDPAYTLIDAFDHHVDNLEIVLEDFSLVEDTTRPETQPYIQGLIQGTLRDNELTYGLTVLQTPTKVYQLLVWTRSDLWASLSAETDSIQQSLWTGYSPVDSL